MKKIILLGAVATAITACDVVKETSETTEEIVQSATGETIDVDYLDKTVRPQDDFFQFANGTWLQNNPVPSSESRWGSFNELDQANKRKLTEILESATQAEAEKGSKEQILGDYYASFMNMDARNGLGISAIETQLSRVNNISSKDEIISVISDLHKLGVDALFGLGVGQDLKDVDNNSVYFGQSGIGLPNRDYYFDESKQEILSKYEKFITDAFINADTPENEASREASLIIKFETKLAEKMMRPAEMRNPEATYNKLSRREVVNKLAGINFDKYLSLTDLNSFDSLIVSQPEFAYNLPVLMKEADLTTWKAYLKWSVLNHYMGHLDDKFSQLNFSFYGQVLRGTVDMKPMNERAINEITGMPFNELLGKAFVEKYYSDNAQKRINILVDNLLEVYQERINGLEWMSDDTKKEALNKLNSIGRKLGFPSKWEDFSDLNISRDDYIGNIDNSARYSYKKNIEKLGKPVDKDEWGMPAHMVNAYYHPLLNEIAFPAGIMQPPFFSENYEDAVNYGRIGMVIGHEFTHGFDDMGSQFAADGSFNNWWTESDRTKFEERTGLLGNTFASFCPIDGHCVNPQLTMGENIADLGGLTLAYHAYTRTPEFKSGISKKGYTPAQRFFIAYAQLWKINYTDEELKNRIANDPHSPGMYRVNGPLMNCPEFFEAFDVKEGDPMRNPESGVARIW